MPVVTVPRYNPNGGGCAKESVAAFAVSRQEIVPLTSASSAVSSLLSEPANVSLNVVAFSVFTLIGSVKYTITAGTEVTTVFSVGKGRPTRGGVASGVSVNV